MSRGVTYNGVESATGGTIFNDMVFWVAQRVPMRNTIVDHIKNNGGKVVPLEKDAHILIADHARKDAHPDSYSWKYITESVKHGCAQLTDRYRIFGHPETPRARVGFSAPVKRSRTPFSAADDAALANWVLAHTAGRTGNSIFQNFAETHSWHTWQSWRNRYVKSLANLPIADLERLAMSAAELAVQIAKPASLPTSSQADPEQQDEQLPKAKPKAAQPKAAQPLRKTSTKQAACASQRPAPTTPSTSPAHAQITTASMRSNEKKPQRTPISLTKSKDSDVGTQDTMRAGFYTDLLTFAEETGADFDPDPCIGGKIVNLWDLSQAVAVQKVPVEEVDWMKVAEDLKYNWVENKDVLAELQKCYENNLADFFEAMSSFLPKYDEEFEHEQRSGPSSPESDALPSSLDQGSNRKRSMGDGSLSREEKPSKRRRLSRNAEIPSTPEEVIGVLTTQSPSAMKAKQLRQAHSSSTKTSASLELPHNIDDEETDDGEGAEAEADTQLRRVPRLEAQQSTFDVTPSQQLHFEALDATPIPLNLRKGHNDGKEQQAETAKSAKQPEASMSKRSLPASFKPASERVSPPQTEARARRPSAPVRVDLEEEGNDKDVRYWIGLYESLGYPRAIVIESLMRTTMTPGWPTISLLEMLQKKEGVPSNYEGIWTDRDDKSLRYADAIEARKSSASTKELNKAKKELDRIVHKHTLKAVDLRRQFLRAQANMSRI